MARWPASRNDHSCAILWPIPHMNQPNQPSLDGAVPTRIHPSPHHLSLSHPYTPIHKPPWHIGPGPSALSTPSGPLHCPASSLSLSLGDSVLRHRTTCYCLSCLHGFVHAASFAWCGLPSWADFHSSGASSEVPFSVRLYSVTPRQS